MYDVRLIDQKTQWINLVKKVKEMSVEDGNTVEIGLFKDVGLISIAKENEFGDPPKSNRPYPIPERSFMRYVFDKDIKLIVKKMIEEASDVLIGKVKMDKKLDEMGIFLTKRIKKFILSDFYKKAKPNHPITIKRKGHDHPLVETGKIVSTLTYKTGKGNPKPTMTAKV